MLPPHQVCVTGMGLCSALGSDPQDVHQAVLQGTSGLRLVDALGALPDARAGVVDGPDLRPWLRRRKDRKLISRAGRLALVAAGQALGECPAERQDIGLYVGVGREPPDDGQSEPTLAVAERDGALDSALLAGPGRDLYPPLLPLQTLPNMVLAHCSINLGIMGPNGAWAGGLGAGMRALLAGVWAIGEGRATAALVGGADSQVDLGSARDRLRLGLQGPPGEAAGFLLIESLRTAYARGAEILAMLEPVDLAALPPGQLVEAPSHHDALGDCGAADAAIVVMRQVIEARRSGVHRTVLLGDSDHPPAGLRVRGSLTC